MWPVLQMLTRPTPRPPTYWVVPPLWRGETVVCIGSGPSLTADDVRYCRGRARVIAINNVYQLAPWADLLYACGHYPPGKSWWAYYPEAVHFPGLKVTLDRDTAMWHGLKLLRSTGKTGLEVEDRSGVRSGYNSGYQAVNLAVHLGVCRIVLLGYDMQPTKDYRHHWHSDHPKMYRPPYVDWRLAFETMVEPLRRVGVEVINCTRETALAMFPRQPLRETV